MHDHQNQSVKSGFFLAWVTYCAKFIPKFSDITQPLTKKDALFQWKEEHDQAFQNVTEMLTRDTVIAYFDKDKQTKLATDASLGDYQPFSLNALQDKMIGELLHM